MDPLRTIEKQSGLLRLLVYLSESGEKQITDIRDESMISVHQLYASIEIAKNWGLIRTRIDNSHYPHRNLVSITKKGVLAVRKLKEFIAVIEASE